MALPAANGAWELERPYRISDAGSTARATVGPTFVDEQNGGVIRRPAQKTLKPLFLSTVFSVTVTSLFVVYTILRCFQNVSIDPTRAAAPRALAEGGPHKVFCSDWPDGGAEGDETAGEGGPEESGRGMAQRPLVVASLQSAAAQQSQQREEQEKGLYQTGWLQETHVHASPSPTSSHSLNPAGPGWRTPSTGPQYARLLPASVSPLSAIGQAPQQSMHSSGHGKVAVTVDPRTSCEHRPCPQQPGEPQVRPPSSALSALGAPPRFFPQEQRESKPVKWNGPDEEGWGFRALPSRYKSMNWRVLRDMEKVAVMCMALTPLLHAREVVSLVVQVASMAALELGALAYCPDDVQPRRGEVCNSFITLLTNITTGGSATLEAAKDMGLLTQINALACVLGEIRFVPPKTEDISLELYKIKYTTRMRVGWYVFEAVGALLDGLFPWARGRGIPTQEPQNVITACESFYHLLKERLLATLDLRAWLVAAQLKARTWVIFSESDLARQPPRLKKIVEAQEDIDKAIVEAGCSPVVFGPHEAFLKLKASSNAPKSLQRPSVSTQMHQHVQGYPSTTSTEPRLVLDTDPEVRLPPQVPQQSLSPMWPSGSLTESPLVSPSTPVHPTQPSHISVPPFIRGPAHFPFVQRPLHQAHRLPHWTRPPGLPVQQPFRLPFLGSIARVPGLSSAQHGELSHTGAPLQASRPPLFAGFHKPSQHPFHQSGSGSLQKRSGTHAYAAEGIRPYQGSQPSEVPQIAPSVQPPPLHSAWPWPLAEQRLSGFSPQEAGAMSKAATKSSSGLWGSAAPLPDVATSRGGPLQAVHTLSTSENLRSSRLSPYVSGWPIAPEKQVATEYLGTIVPPRTPKAAHAIEAAPPLSLPGTFSIWAWSPDEQKRSSWPQSEAFMSHRAIATSEASGLSAAGMWSSGAAAPEAEPSGGKSQMWGEGEGWSGLENIFDTWSIGDDEDD
ncbi:hypothetical protein Emag_000519 [Eimeria magna]